MVERRPERPNQIANGTAAITKMCGTSYPLKRDINRWKSADFHGALPVSREARARRASH